MSHVGIVVVSHGDSGATMVATAEKIVGPLDARIVTVAIGEAREVTEGHIKDACASLPAGEIVFLVDLEGSTPFNVCRKRSGVVISGVNLPMLFKLATVNRDRPALQIAEELAATGIKSIHIRPAVGTDPKEP